MESDGAKNVCADEIALRSTKDRAQKKKWQDVLIETNFEVGSWSPEIMCCRERKMCGYVHKDDFVKDSKQWAWTESQLNEKRSLRRKAVLGLDDYEVDDDDDTAFAIPSHQGEEIEIRKDLRLVVNAVVLWQPSVLSPGALTFTFLSGASSAYRRKCF